MTDTTNVDPTVSDDVKTTPGTTPEPDAAKQVEVEKGYWPDDWRTKAVSTTADEKEREKFLKRLERFSSPEDALKALREQDKKLSSGKLVEPLPEKPTPEQVTEWRKKQGIPTDIKEYEIKPEGGIIIGDDDKPVIDAFLPEFLEAGITPAQANKLVAAYFKIRQNDSSALAEFDGTRAKEQEDALRNEWGGEYRINSNINDNLIASMPEEVRGNLLGGRMADGTLIKDSADFKKMLNQWAREMNPVATITPNTGKTAMQTIDDRMAQIEGMMGTRAYTSDNAIQQEYRDLIDQKERIKGR